MRTQSTKVLFLCENQRQISIFVLVAGAQDNSADASLFAKEATQNFTKQF